MIIDNTIFKRQILSDISYIANMLKTNVETDVYPIATHIFFSRYVELEKFIIDAYINYALGEKSNSGFQPSLNIDFKTKETLILFHKKIDGYMNIKAIEHGYKHLFATPPVNPFENFFTTQRAAFQKLTSIRNVIAHQSESAYSEFYNKCHSGAPCSLEDYLFVYQGKFSNFYDLMNTMIDISETITNPF